MLPVLSQYLLRQQSAAANALQPALANIGALSGVAAPVGLSGLALVNCEKLGLDTTTHYINWSSGVIQGEVTIEVADEVNYTGAWTLVATVTFAGTAPKIDYVTVEGAHGAYRHRITQPVVGGSVTTKIVGTT